MLHTLQERQKAEVLCCDCFLYRNCASLGSFPVVDLARHLKLPTLASFVMASLATGGKWHAFPAPLLLLIRHHLPLNSATLPWRCSKVRPLRDFFLLKFPVQVVMDLWRDGLQGTWLQADGSHLFTIRLSVLTFALFAWLCPSLISGWELRTEVEYNVAED